MMYFDIKQIHVFCVLLSGAGFFLRGLLMLRGSEWLSLRWMRIVPHINDTVLLATGTALAIMSNRYPLTNPWLTAKLCGLLLYITLGSLALRAGRTRHMRGLAWLAALMVYGWIISVALFHQPTGFLQVFVPS